MDLGNYVTRNLTKKVRESSNMILGRGGAVCGGGGAGVGAGGGE